MSFSPYEPSPTREKASRMRPLLALLVLIVAVVGLGLLALNYQRLTGSAATPPTAVAIASATPVGSSGVTGPLQPTPQPTVPAIVTTGVDAATAQPSTPEEEALRTLSEAEVPVRDL